MTGITSRVRLASLLKLLLSCVLLVLLVASQSDGLAVGGQEARTSQRGREMQIPLWKVLPTKHFAVLGEGVVRGRRWAIYAFARGGPESKERPCIEDVNLRYEHGVASINSGEPSCGALAPPNPVPVTTEYVFTNVSGMVVGMTAASSVRQVELRLSDGRQLKLATKLLSAKQATKAKVGQFRFIAVGLEKRGCLESTRGLSSSGEALFETAPAHCVD
jgi:hypothetical protein